MPMKWLHHLLKGISLTAALFVFQACYGTGPVLPPDENQPEVRSETDPAEAETPVTESEDPVAEPEAGLETPAE